MSTFVTEKMVVKATKNLGRQIRVDLRINTDFSDQKLNVNVCRWTCRNFEDSCFILHQKFIHIIVQQTTIGFDNFIPVYLQRVIGSWFGRQHLVWPISLHCRQYILKPDILNNSHLNYLIDFTEYVQPRLFIVQWTKIYIFLIFKGRLSFWCYKTWLLVDVPVLWLSIRPLYITSM